MNITQHLTTQIKSKKVIFLTGAGASLNSGIPIVNNIYNTILELLKFTEEEADIFWNSTFPFETFMASIKEIVPEYFTFILNIFIAKQASSNHHFISNCVNAGYVNSVFTTNFDDLLQKALDEKGIKHQTYYTQKHLQQFSITSENQIVHLHGFIRSKKTIATTIERVAGLWGIESRKKAIHELLNNNEHQTIISLGYSYSDIFDIIPLIEASDNKNKSFLMLDYSSDVTEVISAKKQDLPFSHFPDSYIIKTDIDKLVNDLNLNLFGEEVNHTKYQTEWKSYLVKLFSEFSLADKLAIKAKVFVLLDRPDLTLNYYQKSKNVSSIEKKDFFNSLYINHLNEVGEFETAYKLALQQLENFQTLKFVSNKLKIESEIEIRMRIAVALLNLGELNEAYKHLIISKDFIDDNKLYPYLPECYFYLIDVMIAFGQIKQTESFIKDAIGNCAVHTPTALPMMFGKLADVFYVQGKSEEALDFAKQGWELAKDHGDISDINAAVCRLTSLYISLGDVENSLIFSTELEEITPLLLNQVDKAFNYSMLGKHYSYLLEVFPESDTAKLYQESVENINKSIIIFDDQKMITEKTLSLSELCRTNSIFNNEIAVISIEKQIESELPFIEDRHSCLEIFDCLSSCFQIIGNNTRSLYWLNKLINDIEGDEDYSEYFEILHLNERKQELTQ